jgi:hypothetical protein
MKRGTKSVLFGVHQFIWHPLTVAYAWKTLYGQWPNLYEWIAIFCHDIGYWGKSAMDSPEGQTHPELGARAARRLAYRIARLRHNHNFASALAEEVYELTLYHSTHYATKRGAKVSRLYLPDKACVLVEPMWFYLLRASLSGELKEYVDNDNHKRWLVGESEQTSREWLQGYRTRIRAKVAAHFAQLAKRSIHELRLLLDRALGDTRKCECDICLEK